LLQNSAHRDAQTGVEPVQPERARRLRRLVLGLAALATVAVLGGTGASLWGTRQEAIARAEGHLLDIAQVLGQQIFRSTGAVDILLAGAADDAQRAIRQGRIVPSETLHRHLRQTVAPAPYVHALTLLNANGDLIIYTPRYPAPALNYGDRDYFRAHRDNPQIGLRLSEPVRGKIERELMIPISRRIEDAHGNFVGVIVASVDPSHFLGPQELTELGPDGVVRLLRRDGALLTGYPMAIAAATKNYRDSALFTRGIVAGNALIRHTGVWKPVERISAIYQLREYPLAVTVTTSVEFVLRTWNRSALLFGSMVAAATLLLGFMAWRLVRQLRVDEALNSNLIQSRERLHAIIQSAMDAIVTVDARQRIVLFNAAAEHVFGCPGAQAVGADIGRFIPGHLLERRPRRTLDLDAPAAPMRMMGEHLALTGVRADGREFPIDASVSQMQLRGEEQFIVILRDVTERKQVEAALRENEVRYRTLFNKATDGIALFDLEGNVVDVNPAFASMHGYAADELREMNLRQLDTPETLALAPGRIRRILGGESLGFEVEHYHKDGHVVPLDVATSGIEIDAQQYILAFHRDITERRRAQDELRRSQQELRGLSKAANEALEAERRRTARELHDELGQSLTALKMDLESLCTSLPPDQPELAQRTQAMRALLDGTIAATRRIAANLRPLMLDDLGLSAALDWLTHNFSQHTGIASDLVVDESVAQVPEPIASALYRITQESLTNVAKYAHAGIAEIRLERDGDWVQLTVRDDGRGIESSEQGKGGAFGLLGIRERVTLLGGELSIRGEPGRGTELRARIPLAAAAEREPAA
jgi:PAS domain S-box-containing protein